MPTLPTSDVPFDKARLTRRGFLAAGIASGFAVAACSQNPQPASSKAKMQAAIKVAEAARPHSGHTVTVTLTAQPTDIDLGGVTARTLAYGSTIPGPLIRANVGDELAITVQNRLSEPTSVHWHGIALRNDMDGVEPATPNIPAGQDFTYRFSVPNAGTYWAHPHVGLEEDMGLYLPVIVDDPTEPGNYDAEWIVVMDDWTDGVGKSPQQIYDALTSPNKPTMQSMPPPASTAPTPMPTPMPTSMPTTATTTTPTTTTSKATGTSGTSGTTSTSAAAGAPGEIGTSDLLGGDAGDVAYPYYLINGRIPTAATTLNAKPGQRIRIRFINSGSDTAFRVALAGHSMTVTHTDGFPVVPTQVDALLIGMAERYDVIVTAADGVFPLVAAAEGKNAVARALLVTGSGSQPDPQFRPTELTKRVGTIDMFTATTSVNLGADRTQPQTPGRPGRRHGEICMDHQRRALQQDQPAACPPGPAPDHHLRQPNDDVSPDALARPHFSADQARRDARRPQGHRDRAAQAEDRRRPGRRQPGLVDVALPQHLPRVCGDADPVGLSFLTAVERRQEVQQ